MTVIGKTIVSIVFGLLSLIALVLAVVSLAKGNLVEKTIENSRSIEEKFQAGVSFVEQYKERYGRLPADGYDIIPFGAIILKTSSFPQEIIEKYGSLPEGEYILTYWRGKWSEYYVSWANTSTLNFNWSDYFILGHNLADSILFFIGFFALAFLALRLWFPTRGTTRERRHGASM